MVSAVNTLLNKIRAIDIPPYKLIKLPSTQVCIENFLSHILWLYGRHCRRRWCEEYIITTCYNQHGFFKTEAQVTAFCRVNLHMAVQEFQELLKEMQNDKGVISYSSLKRFKDTIRDYIFDLKPFAEHLERKKDDKYEFFSGCKYYGVMSKEIFTASCQLATASSSKSIQLEHKVSQIAAVFILRQAMEAKFNLLINVIIHDRAGLNPKIRHDFNYNFINENINFFSFQYVDFSLLKYIYKWCNQVVHKAFQPFIWQLRYAQKVSEGLFYSGRFDNDNSWSIHGGVVVSDVEEMQKRYIQYFFREYENGLWCVVQQEPEAAYL